MGCFQKGADCRERIFIPGEHGGHINKVIILILLFLFTGNCFSQELPDQFEDAVENPVIKGIGLGFSSGYSFDKNIYNSEDKIRYNPVGWFSFIVTSEDYSSFAFDLFANFSFQETDIKSIRKPYNNYTFLMLEYGVKLKKYFYDLQIDPYGFIKISGLYGVTTNNEDSYDFTILRGGVLGVGVGFSYDIVKNFMLNVEGGIDLGVAFWDDYPLYNSDGMYFNPCAIKFGASIFYIF